MLLREDIAEVRKRFYPIVSDYIIDNQVIGTWTVEYRYHNDNEWYDLFEDPPEWLCDLIIKELTRDK